MNARYLIFSREGYYSGVIDVSDSHTSFYSFDEYDLDLAPFVLR